ncbi:MAG TPA: lipid droplet-associated protein [Mycobacteriales bacterium]|nr:lipid droplet-associated protein [Mycobacteriales bacterium]HVE28582.1 lipid droplet-associated protein [Mycobacteriales bacterium]
MSTPIPPPLRAAAGLAALTIDAARKVPQQLVGLPVLAVSTALQASLKAQQTYAGLIARGDEVLGQLRRHEDAPWARFDEDEPAAGRPPSAFDAAPEPAEAADGVADALAVEDLSDALTAEAAEETALVEQIERDLDPDRDADVIALDEARAEQAEQAEADTENVLGETEEDEVAAADAAFADAGLSVVDLDVDPAGADRPNGRPEGSGTEPGTDLPADGMALAADASAAGAALAADIAVGGPGGPPVAGYDDLSIPQLRGRLRGLSVEQVEALLGYERATRARPPYLTMLENRLTTLRSR